MYGNSVQLYLTSSDKAKRSDSFIAALGLDFLNSQLHVLVILCS